MKKFVSGLAAAVVLTGGFVAAEGAITASNATVSAPSDYGTDKASVKDAIQKLNNLIDADNLTANKAAKILDKLKDAKDAGVIGKARYKKLKKMIKAAV